LQITSRKVEVRAESRIGSLQNVKYQPGGGDKKIFDDKEYLKQQIRAGSSTSGGGGIGDMSKTSRDSSRRASSDQI
jgi:hypothetical protein